MDETEFVNVEEYVLDEESQYQLEEYLLNRMMQVRILPGSFFQNQKKWKIKNQYLARQEWNLLAVAEFHLRHKSILFVK